MKKISLISLIGAIATAAVASSASAQELDQAFDNWTVYTIQQQGKKTCYIASTPTKESGSFSKRGEAYVLVTNIRNDVDEFSVSSGYPYESGSEVSVEIDGNKFMLFSKGELAWAYDSKQDSQLVAAMKKGSKMVTNGTSQKKTTSQDTYSLKGITKAHERMRELCAK